jgi:hypothetical protein
MQLRIRPRWLSVLVALSPLAVAAAYVHAKAPVLPKPGPTGPTTTKPTPKLPTAPKPVQGKTTASAEVPTHSSSLVGKGSEAARRWITPLLEYHVEKREGQKIEYNWEVYAIVHVINPDTAKSTRVRAICHDGEGKVVSTPYDETVGKMAYTLFNLPKEGVWCTIDADLPVIAYASLRNRGRYPIQFVNDEKVVRFFKAAE